MWREERRTSHRRAALVSGDYLEEVQDTAEEMQKLSGRKALILGAIMTLEIVVLAAMFLNIDVFTVDHIAVLMASVVLYFGVVAFLTDK